jgi:hypothetical protein
MNHTLKKDAGTVGAMTIETASPEYSKSTIDEISFLSIESFDDD